MALEDALKFPLQKRIALVFDYDLTLTEEFQQVPYFRENFPAIQDEYDEREAECPRTGEKIKLSIKEPVDYFRLNDMWGEPHNGICYVQQMLYDARPDIKRRDGKRRAILKNFTQEGLRRTGAKVRISPGLPEFFKKLRKEWKGKCDIRFFIVSVGLEPLIEGGAIAQSGQIDETYATRLACLERFWRKVNGTTPYDAISEVVTPFNKTGYVIAIAKGGRLKLNSMMRHFEYMFDYRNMFVIGDGTSDISQFAYARRKGSRIIGVYRHDSREAFDRIMTNRLIQDRCNAILPRNYTVDSDFWDYVNQKIKLMLERRCNFDPELIDIDRKKKIRSPVIRDKARAHLRKCDYCAGLKEWHTAPPDETIR